MPTPPRGDVTSCHGEGVKVDQPFPALIAVADSAATAQLMRQAQQPSTERRGRSSKARARKKRKLHKEKELISPIQLTDDTDGLPMADVAMSCHKRPQISIDGSLTCVSDSHPKLRQVGGHTNREASIREDGVIDLSRENHHINTMAVPGEAGGPDLRLTAGVRTERVRHSIHILLGANIKL